MPRQIDLFPQNLQVTNDPNNQIAVTSAQISNLNAQIPEKIAQAQTLALNFILQEIDNLTGLNLVAWSAELQQLFSGSSNLLASLTSWITTAYNNWTTVLEDLGLPEQTATALVSWLQNLQSDSSGMVTAWTTFIQSAMTAFTNDAGNWPQLLSDLEAAWSTLWTTITTLAADEVTTLQQIIGSLLGFNTSTGLLPPAQVQSSTGAADLTADWDAVLQPFQNITNLTSTTAWQNSWDGLEALLGVPVAGVNDVQTISPTTSGTQTITFNGHAATSSIANGATAATVLAALDTIAALNGNISVAGTGPWTVTFSNALAGAAQPLMTTNGTGATVTHTTVGGGGLSSSNTPTQVSGNQIASLAAAPGGSNSLSGDLQTHLTNVAAQTGATGSTVVDAAQAALVTQSNTLSSLSSAFQSQQTQNAGASNSGQSFLVTFAAYPNGPFTVAPFNVTYGNIPGQSSHGSGDLIISNGDAAWQAVNNGDVSAVAVYNNGGSGQAYTDTDYQKLTASLAAMPNGAGSKNFAILRCNAAGTDYVYGVVYLSTSYQLDWEIGCYVGGVKHVFSSGVNAPLNLNFTFIAGVGSNPYRFQGFSGNQQVFDYTDNGQDPGGTPGTPTSKMDSSHRYWGFRSDTYSNGQITPAPASYVGCADNIPPSVPGSGIRLYRTSTASQSVQPGNGLQILTPGTFFDAVTENSADLSRFTGNLGASANGSTVPIIQVTNAGRYIVSIRADVASVNTSAGAVTICPLVVRYNSAGTVMEQRLFPSTAMFINGFGGQYNAASFGGTEVIACQAGDLLEACYYLAGGSLSSLAFTGESTGQHTYFEVTLANWSFN